MKALKIEGVESRVISIRDGVLIEGDAAQTNCVNEAVRSNLNSFPLDNLIELAIPDKNEMIENVSPLNCLEHFSGHHKAFTEERACRLGTTPKSEQARKNAFTASETLTKIGYFSEILNQLTQSQDADSQQALMQKVCETIAEIPGNELTRIDTEKSLEFDSVFLHFKHTKEKKKS
jgi:hypothetical protein